MRIGVFLSTREDVVTFSPIYWMLRKAGHRVYLYDVGVEVGWFEKGLQYLSLDYDKLSGHFDRDVPEEFIWSELEKLFEKIEFDYIFFIGRDMNIIPYLKYCYENGIKTVHLGSGLRKYDLSIDDLTAQLIDRYSMINLTYSPIHTRNLLKEGFDPSRVILIGYPILELVSTKSGEAVMKSTILDELGVEEGDYVLIILWRKESLKYIDGLLRFSELAGEYLVCPLPKWGKRYLMNMDKYYSIMERYDITFLETMDILDHLSLIINARSVITDAEWIYVEASALGRPSLLLLDSGEKPLILDGVDVNYLNFDEGVEKAIVDRYLKRSDGKIKRILDASLIRERILETIKRFRGIFLKNEIKLYGYLEGSLREVSESDLIPSGLRRFLI